MTMLFGMIASGGETVPAGIIGRIVRRCDWPHDRLLREETSGAAFFCLQRDTSLRVGKPALRFGSDIMLLFAGRLDNRVQLAADLQLGPESALSDEDIVAAAYRAYGPDFCSALLGDFAIALHDKEAGKLLLARDHIGVMPLYVLEMEQGFAFASALPPLLELPGCDRRWDTQWLVDYLEEVKVDVADTPYRAIRALPPATLMTVTGGQIETQRYWSLPTYAEPLRIGRAEANERFRKLLDEAVSCRLRRKGRVACELSGGLDSSSIAAVAAQHLTTEDERLVGITQAFQSGEVALRYAGVDEGPFADAVYAARPEIERLSVTNATPSLLAELKHTIKRHGAPPRNDFNGIATEAPDLLEKADIRVMLSGFGGDQLVSTHAAGYEASLLAEGEYGLLREHLIAERGWVKGLARLLLWRVAGIRRSRSAKARTKPHLASKTARAAAGYPERDLRHPVRPSFGTIREREEAVIAGSHIAYRLQDTAVGAGARGVEYRYPLLDIRLLEFVHNLPARHRRLPGIGRLPLREATRGLLPDKVRLRADKYGATVPGVFWNIVCHAGELRTFLEQQRDRSDLKEIANFDKAIAALQATETADEFPLDTMAREKCKSNGITRRQVIRLAMLCQWLDTGMVEPERIVPDQENQAV